MMMKMILAVSAILAGFFAMAAGDAVPIFGRSIYTATIAESVPSGYSVTTVTATDADDPSTPAGTLVYSMTSDPRLSIDSATGVVTVIQTPDYEATTKISLTVTANDGDNNLANALLVVTLTDVNDNSPVFMQEYSATLDSVDGTISTMTPLTTAAIDLDSGVNSALTYSIVSGNDNNNFQISSTTGELSLLSPIDASATNFNTINLVIRAVDGGSPPLSTDATVPLSISNTITNDPTYVCTRKWMVQRDDGSDGKCYKLVRGEKSWDAAQNYCRWLGVRSGLVPGNLVTITDSSKQDWIVNSLMYQRRSIWTGLNDQDTEGTMTWIDGTSYDSTNDFSNWAILGGVQQPAGGAVKNCVAIEGTIRSRGAFLGKWNDFKCAMKTWSVCQFPATVAGGNK